MNIPLNIDWQQILLHLLNFTILFSILYFLLYKPVKNFMAGREEYYKNIDAKAEENLSASEAAKAEYTRRLDEADIEIRQEKEKARAEMDRSIARRLETAKAEAAAIISKAREEAERERGKIITGAQSEISEMVAEAAEKLALESTTSEAYDQFLTAIERGKKDDQRS